CAQQAIRGETGRSVSCAEEHAESRVGVDVGARVVGDLMKEREAKPGEVAVLEDLAEGLELFVEPLPEPDRDTALMVDEAAEAPGAGERPSEGDSRDRRFDPEGMVDAGRGGTL